MKSYPSIPHHTKGLFGQKCYAFDKMDGSLFRAEWSKKRGFYKFGSKNQMVDETDSMFGQAVTIFMDKYSEGLARVFRDKYRERQKAVAFAEYYGDQSFAGVHVPGDKMDVKVFDINIDRLGILSPVEFLNNFGWNEFEITEPVYYGVYNKTLIECVQNNTLIPFDFKEGVVCKGIRPLVKGHEQVWMAKIKTRTWLERLKERSGLEALVAELNGEKEIIDELSKMQ